MAWFFVKKFKLVIRDKEIEEVVRREGYSHFLHEMLFRGGPKALQELINQEKLSPNFIKSSLQLGRLDEGTLYRGIHKRDYRRFLRFGNSKTLENASSFEKRMLKRKGLSPERVLWASTNLSKAWEFVNRNNPSIIVLYDEDKLERVDDDPYLYTLKQGGNFKEAVKAYVIVWYR